MTCFTVFGCIMKNRFRRKSILVLSLNPCVYHNIMGKVKQKCGDEYIKKQHPMNISEGENPH
jgi:hypothetical protein